MICSPFHSPRVALRCPNRAMSEALHTTQPGPLLHDVSRDLVRRVEVGVGVGERGVEILLVLDPASREPVPAVGGDADAVEQPLLHDVLDVPAPDVRQRLSQPPEPRAAVQSLRARLYV